eukprot:SAG11_NODE_8973_length_957_cov_178.824009_2_plen_236_part_01
MGFQSLEKQTFEQMDQEAEKQRGIETIDTMKQQLAEMKIELDAHKGDAIMYQTLVMRAIIMNRPEKTDFGTVENAYDQFIAARLQHLNMKNDDGMIMESTDVQVCEVMVKEFILPSGAPTIKKKQEVIDDLKIAINNLKEQVLNQAKGELKRVEIQREKILELKKEIAENKKPDSVWKEEYQKHLAELSRSKIELLEYKQQNQEQSEKIKKLSKGTEENAKEVLSCLKKSLSELVL